MKKLLIVFLLVGYSLCGQLPPLEDRPKVIPTLEDLFTVDRSAGNVHLTPADGRTPSMIRTVVDTENKLSISGGKLVFAGGKTTAQSGDPGIFYPSITRQSGKTLMFQQNASSGSSAIYGYSAGKTASSAGNGINLASASGLKIKVRDLASAAVEVAAGSFGTDYSFAISLRSTGHFVLCKGGSFTAWTLLGISLADSTANLYPNFGNYSIVGNIDNVRIPRTLYIPSPVASDSFARTTLGSTDGLGHQEQNGGAGLAWQTGANNTWSISGGKLVNNPTTGSELFGNGSFSTNTGWSSDAGWTIDTGVGRANFNGGANYYLRKYVATVGNWYKMVYDIVSYTSGSVSLWISSGELTQTATASGITKTGKAASTALGVWSRSSSTVLSVDNLLAYQLPLSDLFCTVSCSSPDVILDVAINGTSLESSGTQAGVVLNLDSPSNPQNFVIIYFDGTGKIRSEKCINGNYSSTGGFTVAATGSLTYGTGKVLRVMHDGSPTVGEYRVFYDNVAVGVITAFTDDAYKNNTYHGTFSTSSNAQFSPITIWARGTEGQYSQLDTLK